MKGGQNSISRKKKFKNTFTLLGHKIKPVNFFFFYKYKLCHEVLLCPKSLFDYDLVAFEFGQCFEN